MRKPRACAESSSSQFFAPCSLLAVGAGSMLLLSANLQISSQNSGYYSFSHKQEEKLSFTKL